MRLLQFAILALGALSAAACHGEPPAVLLADLKQWDAASSSGRRAAADAVAAKEPDFAFVRMETFSCGGQTHEVAIFHHERTGLDFVLVPGGTFIMGSPESETERYSNETQHTVTLTQAFLACRTQCTQAVWSRVLGNNPSHFKGDALPVESVTWTEANAFCTKTGLSLPTEAQWEWACRAGTTTTYCFGDDVAKMGDYAWYLDNAHFETHPVGTKLPNAFGLHDVHSNVVEWCLDFLDEYPAGPVVDPTGPTRFTYKVCRGGYIEVTGPSARSAARWFGSISERRDHCGFRPAKTLAID